MEHPLEKKELVTMFMESPLYFDLRVEERLALLRDHQRRFALRFRESGLLAPAPADPVEAAVHVALRSQGAETGQTAGFIVGYRPFARKPVGT